MKLFSIILSGVLFFSQSQSFAENITNSPDNDMQQALFAIDKENYEQGYTLLLPLAMTNNAEAQYLLGRLLIDELTSKGDSKQGVNWLEKAIQNKHQEAAQTLAKMYLSGFIVPLDPQKGTYYLGLAELFKPEGKTEEECD